jgi:hypothetical protein
LSLWGQVIKREDPLFSPLFFKKEECVHTWGGTKRWTFPLGVKVHPWPWGPSSSLGANFTPRSKLMLLQTGL